MSELANFFDCLPTLLPDELIETLVSGTHVRIERIVSQGHATPDGFWYDQERPEWVLLLQGSARLQFDDRITALKPGDFINIPAHTRHRVEWTVPDALTIWLAIHYDESPQGT